MAIARESVQAIEVQLIQFVIARRLFDWGAIKCTRNSYFYKFRNTLQVKSKRTRLDTTLLVKLSLSRYKYD